MAVLREFKDFINKGNLLAVAIGFVMGAAFTAVVGSLVDNVIMPIAAIPFGEPNFDEALILTVNDAQIRFGAFLTSLVTFLLVSTTVFMLVKAYNRATDGELLAPAGPPKDVVLLEAILEELRAARAESRGEES